MRSTIGESRQTNIKKILVVESHIDLGKSFQMHLNRESFETDIVINGSQAYNKFKNTSEADIPFDLVILDYIPFLFMY